MVSLRKRELDIISMYSLQQNKMDIYKSFANNLDITVQGTIKKLHSNHILEVLLK